MASKTNSAAVGHKSRRARLPFISKSYQTAQRMQPGQCANQQSYHSPRPDLQAAMQHSPLNCLPGELRNKVYEYVLFEPQGIPVVAMHYSTTEVWPDGIRAQRSHSKLGWQDRKPAILGLPRTCRAIYLETLGMYFRVNRVIDFSADFTFNAYELQRVVRRWAAIIGPENARGIEYFRRTIQQPNGYHAPKVRADEIALQQQAIRRFLGPQVRMGVAVELRFDDRYLDASLQRIWHIDLDHLSKAWQQVDEVSKEVRKGRTIDQRHALGWLQDQLERFLIHLNQRLSQEPDKVG